VLTLGAATKFINAEETSLPVLPLEECPSWKMAATNGALLVTALPAILGK
jgi:hypothetical protein